MHYFFVIAIVAQDQFFFYAYGVNSFAHEAHPNVGSGPDSQIEHIPLNLNQDEDDEREVIEIGVLKCIDVMVGFDFWYLEVRFGALRSIVF